MKTDLKQEVVKALGLVQKATDYTNPYNPAELFVIAEKLIAFQAYLLGPMMTLETIYRKKVVEYQNSGKSHAGAESEAKTTQEYEDYQYIKYSYELMGEQIKLIKKFSGELGREYEQAH
jgi:hypothetical protein